MSFDIEAWKEKLIKRTNRKYYNKGVPILALQRRVLSTAISIVELVEEIEFEALSLNLYIMIKDTEFAAYAYRYEGMVELAKEDREKFVSELYQFYDKMAKYILKNKKYRQLLGFISFLQGEIEGDMDKVQVVVYRAYVNIMLTQLEFIKDNKFNINQVLAGITTSNELIYISDPYPNSDIPAYEIDNIVFNGGQVSLDVIKKTFQKYGYTVQDYADTEILRINYQLFSNCVYYLAALINEYTIDILPEKPFNCAIGMYLKDIPCPNKEMMNFEELLTKRARTIPSNGLKISFRNSMFFIKLLLKEILVDNEVCMLYKLSTKEGDISGSYYTKSKRFFSIFTNANENKFYVGDSVKTVVLWAYTAYTSTFDEYELTSDSYHGVLSDPFAEIDFVTTGGKLRVPGETKFRKCISNSDDYTTETRHINGYIRKLPAGSNASERAITLAESLGYYLKSDETYVQPFERSIWISKLKK